MLITLSETGTHKGSKTTKFTNCFLTTARAPTNDSKVVPSTLSPQHQKVVCFALWYCPLSEVRATSLGIRRGHELFRFGSMCL